MADTEEKQVNNTEDKQVSREKARYWVGVLYPENMVDDWEDNIDNLVQVPYAYAIHDKDKEKDGVTPRKVHVHLILCFSNTTTYAHAMHVFRRLERSGATAVNTVQSVVGIRHMYDYLIHDTPDCRKKHKYEYDPSERITGNCFDIGSYEQLSTKDKINMRKELANLIIENEITNFADFYLLVSMTYDDSYFDIMSSYTSFFKALTTGMFQRKSVEK